jgi:YfiR/HmsC-like
VETSLKRRGRWRTRLALVLTLAMAVPANAATLDQGSLEYAVKATYLYKFAPFIDWPPAAFPSSGSPINICVLGRDPFGEVLDRAVAGQRIAGRAVVVVRLDRVDGSDCHIMYLSESDGAATRALDAVRGAPVLTVTDSESEPGAKGIINFVVRDNRVRFEIDESAAAQNGLMISSKLLNLAVSVRPRA